MAITFVICNFHPLKMKLSYLFWPQIKEYCLNFLKTCVKLQFIDVFLNKNAFKFRFAIWSETPKAKCLTNLTNLSVKKLKKDFFITRDMKLNLFPSFFFNFIGKGLFLWKIFRENGICNMKWYSLYYCLIQVNFSSS